MTPSPKNKSAPVAVDHWSLIELAGFGGEGLVEALNDGDWDRVEALAHALEQVARAFTVPGAAS